MAFEFAIYLTDALYDNVGTEPRDWAQKYIDQAVEETTYTTTYLEPSVNPDPPYEIAYNHDKTPFRADPDGDGDHDYYNGTATWLRDWVNARSWAPKAKDVNVLLTNYDGQLGATVGAESDPKFSSVEGGLHFADLTSVKEQGCSEAIDSIQTLLHEVGHGITESPDMYSEHNMGMVYNTSGVNYETPWVPKRTALRRTTAGRCTAI